MLDLSWNLTNRFCPAVVVYRQHVSCPPKCRHYRGHCGFSDLSLRVYVRISDSSHNSAIWDTISSILPTARSVVLVVLHLVYTASKFQLIKEARTAKSKRWSWSRVFSISTTTVMLLEALQTACFFVMLLTMEPNRSFCSLLDLDIHSCTICKHLFRECFVLRFSRKPNFSQKCYWDRLSFISCFMHSHDASATFAIV